MPHPGAPPACAACTVTVPYVCTAQEYVYHIPVPELTAADLNATIVTLNLPLIGVVEAVHAATGPVLHRLLDLVLRVLSG